MPPDSNRLELDIVAVDQTGDATKSSKANFRSIEQEATRTAAGMSNGFDRQSVQLAKSIDSASVAAMRSFERLEARAALAGKNGVEKLIAQKNQLLGKLGDNDKAVIDRVTTAYERLIAAQRKLDTESATRRGGLAAGKAVLPGEAEFQAALKKVQAADAAIFQLQRSRVISEETPAQKLRREESEFTSQYGISPGKRGAIAEEFAAQRKNATGALKASLLEEEEALKRAEIANAGFFRRMAFHAKEWASSVTGASREVEAKLGHGRAAETGFGGRAAEAAEAARLGGGGGPIAAFGGLGKLFEVGLVAGFATHFIDELVRTNIELGHLSITTGIGIRALAGFNQVVKEQGGDVERFDTGLVKMENSIQKARDGSEKTITAFHRLGITTQEINTLTPEQMLYKLAVGFKNAENSAIAVNAATTIFSKGGAATMIPVLAEAGDGLEKMVKRAADLSGITPEVVEASRKWNQQTERLAQVFHLVGNVALQILIPTIQVITQLFDDLGAAVLTVFDVIVASVVSGARSIVDFGTVLKDVVTGNWSALAGDAQNAKNHFVNIWGAAGKDIKAQWTGANKDARLLFGKVPSEAEVKRKIAIPDEDEEGGEAAGRARKTGATKSDTSLFPELYFREFRDALTEKNRVAVDLTKKQTEATFRAFEEAEKRKVDARRAIDTDIEKNYSELRSKRFEIEASENDRARQLALQQLGLVDAQSLKEKQLLEEQKFSIEKFYADKALGIQLRKIQVEKDIAVGAAQAQFNKAGYAPGTPEYNQALDVVNSTAAKYDLEMSEAISATSDKEKIEAQRVADEKTKLGIEQNRKIFDNLKQAAGGLFDALFEKSKSWADFFKGLFKTAILTPLKDIFSSQVAGFITRALTGQSVSFSEIGNGQGAVGRIGSVLGRLGLGTPRFGVDHGLANINQPNHLGDVNLVSGAVPVLVTNGGSGQLPWHGFSLGSVAGLGGLLLGAGSGGAASPTGGSAVGATIRYALGGATGSESVDFGVGTSGLDLGPVLGQLPGAPSYQGSDAVGYDALDQATGGGGGGFLGKFGGIGSGLLGGFKHLFGLDTSGTDLGNGIGIARSGFLGNLAAIGKSTGAALIGGTLALDGIRRGGIGGALEAGGGGALVGFKFGGPIGALIGAGVGAGISIFKSLFGDDRRHTKDLVKQVYGISINDATADQIIQIAKQSYGGQISVAVRSQQVRDLLRLYAQTTGQKNPFVADKAHSASLVEANGKLYQNAVYDNGQAYSYQSPLSVYGGVQTSTLPTSGPLSGGPSTVNLQLALNGDSALSALGGQVVRVATPGFVQGQAIRASQSSNGRLDQTALTLAPAAITR